MHGEPFLRTIEPLSARPFNFPKEFHLTEAEVNQIGICFYFAHFIGISTSGCLFIGSKSERSLPHWGGYSKLRSQGSSQETAKLRVFCLQQFILNILLLLQMITWIGSGLFISSGWSGDFAVTQWLCTWAHTDPQLDQQNVLDSWCDWTLFNSF